MARKIVAGKIKARRLVGALTAFVLAALCVAFAAPSANATVTNGKGYLTVSQPYAGNPDKQDWVGSYLVNGKQAFCVQFAFKAPDSDEQYKPGDVLKTKWGTDLTAPVAANISYLLLRYGDTTSNDEAAALAHLLHSWTSPPRSPADLDPAKTFREIGYDAPLHFNGLPAAAQAAVDRLTKDAEANHGPWKASVTAPTTAQLIGTADTWTVNVNNAAGTGVASVPVTFTLTDATLPDGKTSGTIASPKDGSPLAVKITPTGSSPSVSVKVASPAAKPLVQEALEINTQRLVMTGGESVLAATAKTDARTKPGAVNVTKIDERTKVGIAGVALRVTGADKTSPALSQDDKPLIGADGKAAVVVTDADGIADVPNLRTPQAICIIEVAAPPGYEQGFDPANPPSVCGTVSPGETLALSIANKPNVPKTIPAGFDDGPAIATASVTSTPHPAALAAVGGLLLLTAGSGAVVWRRRVAGRR